MTTKGLWQHELSMDVIYEVLAVYYVSEEFVKVKYRSLVLTQSGKLEPVSDTMKAKVYRRDFGAWQKVDIKWVHSDG